MSNNYFQFKRFIVRQERCAMKVGTDGCLLGAWANGGQRILDVGTGTGLIALMMAQRFPESHVTGIDIDGEAVCQASENAAASPFADRVSMAAYDFAAMPADAFSQRFDSIVSNPPYYIDALSSPDPQRTLARHAVSLTYAALMQQAARLLEPGGEVSVVVPAECRQQMESAAALAGLMPTRLGAVRTTERKPVRRYLLAFARGDASQVGVENTEIVIGTSDFVALMRDFYLNL
jgi:tRNA1Val (adenine37-N6)-methyltransferase